MAELEELKKTLILAVGSLQSLIAKQGNNQNTLEPERPKLKKTPEMTYNEFIKRSLGGRKPVEVTSKKNSFKLQEDLELLDEVSNYNQISSKTFEDIANSKKLNRTTDALKSRYQDLLCHIDEKEMKKIVDWVEKEGVEGYLTWEDEEIRISLNDHNDKKETKKRHRPTTSTEPRKLPKGSKKAVPVNCKELSEVVKFYSKMVKIPPRALIEKLDQLSGSFVDLDDYLETRDSRMLWTTEEDEILKKGGIELELLKRYRGSQSV
jgi:hypothetical protein